MRNLVFLLLLGSFALANSLVLQDGKIQAHTEVFGDSTINPASTNIESDLTMEDTLESIKGNISIKALSFVSDNKDRDEHMYKVLNSELNPTITFKLTSIVKQKDGYKLSGLLTLNGVSKKIDTLASIYDTNNTISFSGNFSILLTDFNMEPPTMFFLTVRDLIDIKYSLIYNKG
ncbi:MAG: YceI family protein [Halarcobacter sp.]